MVSASAFHKFLVLLPLAYPNKAPINESTTDDNWNYDNPNEWGGDCNGYRQSPIHLKNVNSLYLPMPALRFVNYDIPLEGPLTVVNNGHSIDMAISVTQNGESPYISGGMMNSIYEAQALHIHWGSKDTKGSEHMINNRRFDAEMHIVHKNINYATIEEATKHKDGIAVIGVMFKKVQEVDRYYPGLNKLFNLLPFLTEYESEANINGIVTLGQFLGDLNTKNFYTYSGSLTTPPCSEAVTWHVFPEPLPIAYSQIEKFWNILDENNYPQLNNWRPIQKRGKRPIFYRSNAYLKPDFVRG